MTTPAVASAIVPARVEFLAIYNPDLGRTDDTFRDQVVFWWSRAAKERRRDGGGGGGSATKLSEAEENEMLRQIGLAQGMVDFAKSFANGQPVDSIDTEKSRIVLHELENDWWVLASIQLTKIPVAVAPGTASKDNQKGQQESDPTFEYSSREVSPAALLLRQIIDGHRMFLLHNGASLSRLFYKLQRQKFCGLLERFWNRFAQNWDVLLHGNPAVEVFGGLKLAAGGELGMGVGEEEWGSGEREVLEDFARRTDGLVDLMVSRFGEPSKTQTEAIKQGIFGQKKSVTNTKEMDMWLGAGNHAQVGDGLVFSGVGAISRTALRDLSRWAQDIYAYGDSAYGVGIHPSNDRRKRRRRQPEREEVKDTLTVPKAQRTASPNTLSPPGIPPPIVTAVERSLERATSSHDVKKAKSKSEGEESEGADSAGWTKYLTLGYGSSWGQRSTSPFKREDSAPLSEGAEPDLPAAMRQVQPEPDIDPDAELEERFRTQVRLEENGHFLIGLKGEMTDESQLETDDEDDGDWNQRTMVRTLYVEVTKEPESDEIDASPLVETPRSFTNPHYGPKLSRLRVIVYVHRPFIYTFLFHPRTESLSLPGFYKNVHTFFAPLHKPLSASTSPARVAVRIAAAAEPSVPPSTTTVKDTKSEQQPIFDLVYDPRNVTIHASIPNIPMPGSLAAEGLSLAPGGSVLPEGWSRAEALNVHSAILEIIRTTRRMPGVVGEGGERELERSVKTGRGWWVVWMRLDDEAHLKKQPSSGSKSPTARSSGEITPTMTSPSKPPTEEPAAAPQQTSTGKDYFTNTAPQVGGVLREESPASDASVALLADSREAILVRRARDASSSNTKKGTSSSGGGLWSFGLAGGSNSGDPSGKDAASGWGPARLAEGVGVDARKYVEGLLSLNR
jgi:hypothetical protein